MALSDGGIKGVMRNFSPAYNLVKKDDKEDDSLLRKAMKQGAAGKAAGMKKGGKVKKNRGDGICRQGKTKGRMI
jgi:small nuclear ribonucleoprotein (snRNP)-like protein